jgi:hypothetical protein
VVARTNLLGSLWRGDIIRRRSLYDENAEVLRDLDSRGCELGSPRIVDFSFVFPNRAFADAFALDAERLGFSTATEEVEREENPWDATASKEMAPTCGNITEAEEHLSFLAQTHRGRSDGWGLFGI